ncbi:MAG: hypothetical protein II336_06520 [Loktanella sp.]|nr:hypothetical protein [Loktanella sp.]
MLEDQTHYRIEKMDCGGCARTISSTIHMIGQGAQVDIDVTSDADQAFVRWGMPDTRQGSLRDHFLRTVFFKSPPTF